MSFLPDKRYTVGALHYLSVMCQPTTRAPYVGSSDNAPLYSNPHITPTVHLVQTKQIMFHPLVATTVRCLTHKSPTNAPIRQEQRQPPLYAAHFALARLATPLASCRGKQTMFTRIRSLSFNGGCCGMQNEHRCMTQHLVRQARAVLR